MKEENIPHIQYLFQTVNSFFIKERISRHFLLEVLFLSVPQQSYSDLGRLIVEVSRSHTHTRTR